MYLFSKFVCCVLGFVLVFWVGIVRCCSKLYSMLGGVFVVGKMIGRIERLGGVGIYSDMSLVGLCTFC